MGGAQAVISWPEVVAVTTQTVNLCGLAHLCRSLLKSRGSWNCNGSESVLFEVALGAELTTYIIINIAFLDRLD